MSQRGKHWVFTVNNWTSANDELLKALGTAAGTTYLVYGYEEGESGTPHLQGYIALSERKRFNQVKELLPAGAHIEGKKGSPKQAADYCKKDGIFQEYGHLPSNGATGSACFDNFKEWVLSEYSTKGRLPSEREIAAEAGWLYVRYGRKLQDYVRLICPQPVIVDKPLRDWQIPLFEAIAPACDDDRSILFYVDPEGGKGKSFFTSFMLGSYPDRVQTLGIGKRDDIAHEIDPLKDIFIFDIGRGQSEFLSYPILEMLKNRIVHSPKYESTTKILNRIPHVIVFMNEEPDQTKLTGDRYIVESI